MPANKRSMLVGLILALVVLLAIVSSGFFPNSGDDDSDRIAVISLSSDDGSVNDYLRVFPILSKYNITMTVFVITNKIGTPNHLNLSQLSEMQSSGWEIGSHSMSHRALVSLNSTDLLEEVNGSKTYLECHGFHVETFAYPHGDTNSTVSELVKDNYVIARAITPQGNYLGYSPRDLIGSSDVRAMPFVSDFQTICKYIDRAIERHEWVNFYFHSILSDGKTNDTYSWTLEDLAFYIAQRVDAGLIKAMTFSGAYSYYRNSYSVRKSLATPGESSIYMGTNNGCAPYSIQTRADQRHLLSEYESTTRPRRAGGAALLSRPGARCTSTNLF